MQVGQHNEPGSNRQPFLLALTRHRHRVTLGLHFCLDTCRLGWPLNVEWQLCCDDDIVDWNSNSNVMDNNVCPVSVSPWQPNYLPADLSDVSRYPRAVSGDPSLGKWLRIAISEITFLATWVIINLPNGVRSPDNSVSCCIDFDLFSEMIHSNARSPGRGGVRL